MTVSDGFFNLNAGRESTLKVLTIHGPQAKQRPGLGADSTMFKAKQLSPFQTKNNLGIVVMLRVEVMRSNPRQIIH